MYGQCCRALFTKLTFVFVWHLVSLIVKYSVNITGVTFEMLLKYLTQSKIRLIVKAPVVILSVLRKTCNVLLTFVLAVHTNCRLYSLKQKLLLSCAVFRKNFVLLILFQSFVLQSYFKKGQWKFPPHIKAYKNPVTSQQVPAPGSPRFGLFTVII